jgi:hypothetical protein
MKKLIYIFLPTLIFILISCAEISTKYHDCPSKVKDYYEITNITLSNNSTKIPLNLYLAATNEEHTRGLMCLRDLKNINGMLFSFQKEQISSFWMYKTFIPLTIIYFDSNNYSVDFFDMKPCKRNLFQNKNSYRQKCYEESNNYIPKGKYINSIEIIESFEKLEEIKSILKDDKLKLMINN